jgi:dCMP deaminase
MKLKHIQMRMRQVKELTNISSCQRRGVAAIAVTENNIVLSEAYNGWIRGAESSTCNPGGPCFREGLTSGSNMEVGCIHAEQNLIINAARTNTSLVDSWVFLSTYPCMMCAKLLAQSGISRLFVLKNSYPVDEGITFLRDHGVICVITDVTST